ncbi:MAG: hypothetical protein KGO05_16035, partial [Chloroflexota bacterium]|nr:hypothetical protein [Chloroflexota bacterium]
RDYARPTPVATLTGWTVSAEEVTRAGLARLISKPFDLDDLIIAIADCVDVAYTAEQQRQAETLGQLCAAFDAGDVEAVIGMCVPDVRTADILAPFTPDGRAAPSVTLTGQAALGAMLERLLAGVPEPRLDDYLIYPQPSGLALRFVRSWRDTSAPGARATQATSALIQFQDERISEINLLVGARRWNAVIPETARISHPQSHPL